MPGPDAALKGLKEPVLLDEWQEAPDVLSAVKRACDADPRPGRFILTGSVRGEVRTRSWPGTGRVTDIRMFPMTKLAKFFTAYALGSASTTADATLFQSAGIDRRTADRYLDLLNRIYVVDEIPAWSSNRLKRVVRSPKRMVADAALIAVAARAETDDVMLDSQLLGRMMETLVIVQLRAQAKVSDRNIGLYHLRTHGGRQEIDLIAELPGGLMAVEVKSTGRPRPDDTEHLEWLRDQTGDRFLAGMLLHTGPSIYKKSDRIWALPISTLWQPLPGQ